MSISGSRVILIVACVGSATVLGTAARFTVRHHLAEFPASATQSGVTRPIDGPPPIAASEQEWIVGDVFGAIAGFAEYAGSASPELARTFRKDVQVVSHLWSPETFSPWARRWFEGLPESAGDPAARMDLNVRAALTDLTVETMLDQNERVSAALTSDVRSPGAHESAALLAGALALRESSSMFGDVRPILSRMTAHLAVAQALRRTEPRGIDGTLATAILTVLAGRERDALAIVDGLDRGSLSSVDRAWTRALRLRITGDWRRRIDDGTATRLERFEYARALRTRVGDDALLDFLDTQPPDEVADWQRIGFPNEYNVEAGHRFAGRGLELELAEARKVWMALHGREIERTDLVRALNDRSPRNPVSRRDRAAAVHVLDWGVWAASYHRHVCQSLVAMWVHAGNLGDPDAQEALTKSFENPFGELTLYPVVLRWIANTAAEHEQSLMRARSIAESTPELLTARGWALLLRPSPLSAKRTPFPLHVSWFTPPEPAGTAFDLQWRSLQPGCPRPPTRAQAMTFARLQPYDHWTQWAVAYLMVDQGKPTYEAASTALGPLMEYDAQALIKVSTYIDASRTQHEAIVRRLCEISPRECGKLGDWLLRDGQEEDAAAAYEQWVARARDGVAVSNGLTWIVRYYMANGKAVRAEELAGIAARTGSAGGMETLAHFLDRAGRADEAERLYERIAERYRNATAPLGVFRLRRAIQAQDKALEMQAWELLRPAFPTGLERLHMHALDVTPLDGVAFQDFGRRAADAGLKHDDIIVGVDEWRVRSWWQFSLLSRLRHDPVMTFTVWRDGKYRQLRTEVPERWLGVRMRDYRGAERTH